MGNKFESIPSVLRSLPQLYMLSFKSNRLTHIPEDALAPTIEWLILTDNLLEELPASVGCLNSLRKCKLTNNRLLALPDSLLQCRELELIRLADNRLSDLPRGFWQLPKLAGRASPATRSLRAPRRRRRPAGWRRRSSRWRSRSARAEAASCTGRCGARSGA